MAACERLAELAAEVRDTLARLEPRLHQAALHGGDRALFMDAYSIARRYARLLRMALQACNERPVSRPKKPRSAQPPAAPSCTTASEP